jgi:Flp pilus assembly protein protease CpaA
MNLATIVTTVPLLLFLVVLVSYELLTGLIRDVATIPAATYFVTTSAVFGPAPWWQYPVALVAALVVLLLEVLAFAHLFDHEVLGGGAIKLLAVVAGALGLNLGVQVLVLFLLLAGGVAIIATAFFNQQNVPSSPLIFMSVACVLAYNRLAV